MREVSKFFKWDSSSIAMLYLIVALVWILLSDQLLAWITSDPWLLSALQSMKGIAFVLVTSLLLFFSIRMNNREILTEKRKIDNALQSAKVATWGIDLNTDENFLSKEHYKLFGLQNKPENWTLEHFVSFIHPEDKERVRDTFYKAVNKDIPYLVEYRIIWPDQTVHWLRSRGTVKKNASGQPLRISGVVSDITDIKNLEEAYIQKKELFESIFENIPVMITIYDPEINHIQVNQAFEHTLGWTNEEMAEIDLMKVCYPEEKIRERAAQVMQNADGSWHEFEVQTKSDDIRIQEWANLRLSDDKTIGIGLDITERIEAETKLAESEKKYRLLFEQNPLPMWIYDYTDLSFIEVNNAAVKHYGYSREEFSTMTLTDIRPPEDVQKFHKSTKNIPKTFGDPEEWRHQKKNGETIIVRITGTSIKYNGKKHRLILANDITEQKKADERILASFIEGENEERARLSRELHDGLGQYLAAANMNLDAMKDELDSLDQKKKEQFDSGLAYLKYAINETSSISHNLLPRVIEDYGLALAVETLIDNYIKNTETKIDYYQNIDAKNLTKEIEFNLYRIVQESLSNAVKYAGANHITVQLIEDNLDLILTIDDNGVGFDKKASDFKPGLGLQTIRTRAGALGGFLEIESKPGKGTLINVIVPLNKNQ